MISRFRLFSIAVLTCVLLTACLPVTFPAYWNLSDSAVAYYPPSATSYYDWFWMEIPSAQLETLLNNTGSYSVRGRVCFPGSAFPRYYLHGFTSGGNYWYNTTTSQGCTAYVMMGTLIEIANRYQFVSTGQQKMAAMGAGETFYVELALEANYNSQPVTIGVNAKVATESQSSTWHTF